jgi:hypothetical protein
MLVQCPHCQQSLTLSEAQLEKIQTALAALSMGRTLKIGCPKCRQPIELNSDGSVAGQATSAMMDELFSEHTGDEDQAAAGIVAAAQKKPQPVRLPPEAPKPPDLSWLSSGVYSQKEAVENVPHALIMIGNEEMASRVSKAVGELGYQPTYARSAEEAIGKMQFMNFEAVVLHSRFEGGDLNDSAVHQYLQEMGMSRRRYIFYVLIGPEFRTLYDLEALANSANLVVNDSDVGHFPIILKRGMNEYQELFGPYLEALGNYGVK